jgi:CspA family cold shock protein
MSDRRTGTIARIIPERGFGFIKATDGQEYFFHASALENLTLAALQQGDPVSFVEEPSAKGPRASKVAIRSKLVGNL